MLLDVDSEMFSILRESDSSGFVLDGEQTQSVFADN